MQMTKITNSYKGILAGFVIMVGISTNALAEKSSVFAGFDIGYGEASYELAKIDYVKNNTTTLNKKERGIALGFVVGYKQFFTPYLGLRYYVNTNIANISFGEHSTRRYTKDGEYIGSAKITLAPIINYGVNIDFLGNFIAKEGVDFGGFVGVGLGGNHLSGGFEVYGDRVITRPQTTKETDTEVVKTYQQNINHSYSKPNTNVFDVWVNVGLRANIAKHHAIEMVARVPFISFESLFNVIDSYVEKKTPQDGKEETTYGFLINHSLYNNIQSRYSISFRYIYNF